MLILRSLMTKGNNKKFQARPIKKKIIYDPFIFVKNSFFSKFDPLTATGMAHLSILGQNVKI